MNLVASLPDQDRGARVLDLSTADVFLYILYRAGQADREGGAVYGNLTMSLLNNATLLLALSILYDLCYAFCHPRNRRLSEILCGLLIGGICVAIMSLALVLEPGIIFDTRSILISVAALTFGAVPAAIASAMAAAYRLLIGGAGALTGCVVIAASMALGLAARRLSIHEKSKLRLLKLYLFGIAVHLAMVACMFLLPLKSALDVLQAIAFPVMIICPVGTVLLSTLLIRQKEHSDAAEAAAEAGLRYRSLFYNSHAVMLMIDPEDGRIVDANPAAALFYGWPVDTLKTIHIWQINTLPPDEIREKMKSVVAGERSYFIFQHNRASGTPADVEVYSGPIEFGGKKFLYSIVHDISGRVAAEAALRESEERFKQFAENSPEAIFVMVDRKFAFVNKAGLKLLGAKSEDELLGQSGLTVIHPDHHMDVDAYMHRLYDGVVAAVPVERTYVRLDGTLVSVESLAVPIVYKRMNAILVFARDITEKKRLQKKEKEMEAQLMQQQKLEAIGTLASGVAHEINNPLNGIMNYAQLILDASVPESSIAEYASEVIRETERISVIVKNLLQFSRHDKQTHSYASIYDIVGQTVSLVNTVIKKDQIRLDIQLDEGLPEIKCRSQQIQQVIMNLLTNARDALNEKYPGYHENKVIRLRCSEHFSDGRRYLRLTVLDYGVGIPREIRDRIFEPFFSTKPKEIGTGLGLSISYGIVSEHHGKIFFESEPGKYTMFILDLPVDNGWTLGDDNGNGK